MRTSIGFLGLIMGLGLLGCSASTSSPVTVATTTQTESDEGDHDHDHDRDKMMTAHLGARHIWLTARVTQKQATHLEFFLEKPLPLTKIVASARKGDGTEVSLQFEPAPVGERPKDPEGKCSRFVVATPWLMATDEVTIVAEVESDGRVRKPRFKGFIPEKYAHKSD